MFKLMDKEKNTNLFHSSLTCCSPPPHGLLGFFSFHIFYTAMYFVDPSNVQQKYKHEPAHEILVLFENNKGPGNPAKMISHTKAFIASNDAITCYLFLYEYRPIKLT